VTPGDANATVDQRICALLLSVVRGGVSSGDTTRGEAASSNRLGTRRGVQPGTQNPHRNKTIEWDRDEIRILPNPTQNKREIAGFIKQQEKYLNLSDAPEGLWHNGRWIIFGYSRRERYGTLTNTRA